MPLDPGTRRVQQEERIDPGQRAADGSSGFLRPIDNGKRLRLAFAGTRTGHRSPYSQTPVPPSTPPPTSARRHRQTKMTAVGSVAHETSRYSIGRLVFG
ncbi:hypothetical protein ACWEQ8_33870 [Streptomyces noursei]